MTARPVPQRHWSAYGNDPLPTDEEALDAPLRAFPSWFLRVECDRCGKVQLVNQVHMRRSELPIREILERMRRDGCRGRGGKAELLSSVEGASNPAGAADRAAGGV